MLRRRELTTLFANPGSTEVPFLTGLPDDLVDDGTMVLSGSA